MEVHTETPCGCPCHGVRPRLGFGNTAICPHCEGPNPTFMAESAHVAKTPTLEEEWAYLQEELHDASETGWLEVSLILGAVRALLLAGAREAFRFSEPCQASGLLDCGDGSSATACWEHKLCRRIEELGT